MGAESLGGSIALVVMTQPKAENRSHLINPTTRQCVELQAQNTSKHVQEHVQEHVHVRPSAHLLGHFYWEPEMLTLQAWQDLAFGELGDRLETVQATSRSSQG